MDPDPDLSSQIEQVERQFAQNPDGLVFARLADLYRRSGEPERGLEVLDHGLEKNPEYAGGHVVRGRCLRALGRDGAAEESFRRVLELDSQNQPALRNLGDLALEKGDRAAAARWFEELIQLDSGNEAARQALDELRAEDASAGSTGDRADDGGPGADDGAASGSDTDEEPAAGRDVPGEAGVASARGWDEISLEAPSVSDAGPESAGGEGPEDPGTRGDDDASSGGGAEREGARDPEARESDPEGRESGEADLDGWGEVFDIGGVSEEAPGGTSEARSEPGEGGGRDEDLLTRTLANLYATQGLYDEAAEMYRELLAQRPDDEELRKRLAEVREAGAGQEASGGATRAPGPGGDGEEPTDGASGSAKPAGRAADPSRDGVERGGGAAGAGEPSAASRPDDWKRSVGAVEPPSMTMEQHLRELLRGEAVPGLVNRRLEASEEEGTPSGGAG